MTSFKIWCIRLLAPVGIIYGIHLLSPGVFFRFKPSSGALFIAALIFIGTPVVLWIYAEVLRGEYLRKRKVKERRRAQVSLPRTGKETFPVKSFPIETLPARPLPTEFRDSLRTSLLDPKRAADLLDQLSRDKLSALISEGSQKLLRDLAEIRPDMDEFAHRVDIVDRKGPFNLIRKRRVHTERVKFRKKPKK